MESGLLRTITPASKIQKRPHQKLKGLTILTGDGASVALVEDAQVPIGERNTRDHMLLVEAKGGT